MLRKKFILFLLAFFFLAPFYLYLLPPNSEALAGGEFVVDVNVVYDIDEKGQSIVTHNVSLENLFSNLYARSYVLSLSNIDPVEAVGLQGQTQLDLTQTKEGDITSIEVKLVDAVVGKGKKTTFSISFSESSFATRTGEVWEISIPRLGNAESFRNYDVVLNLPLSMGEQAYVSPDPVSQSATVTTRTYIFDKAGVQEVGISAGFGDFQIFSFTLNYHLENPLTKKAKTEIALPPDTAFQRVFLTRINIEPSNVYLDPDNNWLAVYELKPRERLDIVVDGAVQIFANPRPFLIPSQEQLNKNLGETAYWQVYDPFISQLGAELGTPRNIYDYVRTTLGYDLERVKPNVVRKGAALALQSPLNSICMEFTDTFIALSRAAGIPSREVNGFAYTENPDIQPLSLVADVLHAWPEYWDYAKSAWIPIDPTWASTTGGVDYFSKLDLRHFTFVNHGENSITPYSPGSYKLGPNPQKDVFVNFGQLPVVRSADIAIESEMGVTIPFFPSKVLVSLHNPGPTAKYALTPTVFFDGEPADEDYIEVLPPFATYKFETEIPFSFLGINNPEKIIVSVDGTNLTVPANKMAVMLYNLLAIFVIAGVVIFVFYARAKKLNLKTVITGLKKTGIAKFKNDEKTNITKEQGSGEEIES